MYMALRPGALGMKVDGLEAAIKLARDNGFQGVEFSAHEAASLIDARGADAVRSLFHDSGIRSAGWGLPVEWRRDEQTWRKGLDDLPRLARAAAAIGSDRCSTWVMPCSNERALDENWKFHVSRFKPIAEILGEHGCRLGLEFIGPRTLRESQKHPFIHTMEDMLRLGSEIGPNTGLLLDSWHWYTSGGTVDDIREVDQKQVVYVHVNDAPLGVPVDQQIDNKRCLPGATGVIDIRGFLTALTHIGYDGPVVPEPFGNPASWAADALRLIWRQAGL